MRLCFTTLSLNVCKEYMYETTFYKTGTRNDVQTEYFPLHSNSQPLPHDFLNHKCWNELSFVQIFQLNSHTIMHPLWQIFTKHRTKPLGLSYPPPKPKIYIILDTIQCRSYIMYSVLKPSLIKMLYSALHTLMKKKWKCVCKNYL